MKKLSLIIFSFILLYSFNYVKAQDCPMPTNLKVLVVEGNTCIIQWDGNTLNSTYVVGYHATGDTVRYHTVNGSANLTGIKDTLNKLKSLTLYWVKVRGACSSLGRKSPYTDSISFISGQFSCFTPNKPNLISNTSTTCDISWSGHMGDSSYVIKATSIKDSSYFKVPALNPLNMRYTLTGLKSGATYTISITAYCSGKKTDYSTPITVITDTELSCELPTALTVSGITAYTANVSWTADTKNVIKYIVKYKGKDSLNYHYKDAGTKTSFIVGNLKPNIEYEWSVKMICQLDIIRDYTVNAPATFKTLAVSNSTCELPSGFAIGTLTAYSAQVSWTGNLANVVKYVVKYRPKGSTEEYKINDDVLLNQSYIINYLKPNTEYEWCVKVVCNLDKERNFVACSPIDFKTSIAPSCNIPGVPQVVYVKGTTAEVRWTGNPTDIGYVVKYQAQDGSSAEQFKSYSGTVQNIDTIKLTSLLPNSTYFVWVRSKCALGKSDYSMPTSFITGDAIVTSCNNIPSTPVIGTIGSTTCNISWTGNASDSCYIVKYKAQVANSVEEFDKALTTTHSLGNLQPATNYLVWVKSVCKSNKGKSEYSAPASFRTDASAPLCNIPGKPVIGDVSGTSCVITWTGQSGDIGYVIKYQVQNSNADEYSKFKGTVGTSNTFKLRNLLPNTNYTVSVRSICASGKSDYSIVSSFNTYDCAPSTDAFASEITEYTAKILIIAPDNPNLYCYSVQYRKDGAQYDTMNVRRGDIKNSVVVLSNLERHTSYYFKVKTICKVGASTFTTISTREYSFMTLPNLLCPTPTGLAANSVTSTSATMSWDFCNEPGLDMKSYLIRYYKSSEPEIFYYNAVASNPIAIEYLKPSTEYNVQVRTIWYIDKIEYKSDYSSVVKFTTTASKRMMNESEFSVNYSVNPNPNNGSFTLSLNNNQGKINVSIFNIQGQMIYSENILEKDVVKNIDLTKFEKGIYILKLSDESSSKIEKIIIQ